MNRHLNLESDGQNSGSEALGEVFESREERDRYFGIKLKESIEKGGLDSRDDFPKASMNEVVGLSNPPFYTACPNPFLPEFVKIFGNSNDTPASSQPYIGDLVADSRHPVYSYHPYHTKVPPAVIKTLIEHYTRPGDLVLDAFSGSGMTGVAARECGRNAIVVDLAPIAGFISAIATQNNPGYEAAELVQNAIEASKSEFGWLYKTRTGHRELEVNYFVWSDLLP